LTIDVEERSIELSCVALASLTTEVDKTAADEEESADSMMLAPARAL
jgi:hypothetical protein